MADPRVLIVHEGVASGPSATVRALQYLPMFEREWNAPVRFIPRKPDWHPRLVNSPSRVVQLSLLAAKRGADLFAERDIARRTAEIVETARSCDVVYLLKVPSIDLYRQLRAQGTRIVMDLNDALWLPFNQKGGWENLSEMLSLASLVVCDNEYVASWVTKHGARARVVPDPAQVEVFDRERAKSRRNGTVIGWVGSRWTVDSLYAILEPLEAVFARHPELELRVVGAPAEALPRFENVRFSTRVTYDQTGMVEEVLNMDIGLFPMFRLEDSLARGILKATIYMAGEALVIAQAIGANPALITDGKTGLLADATSWERQIERALEDADGRRRMAAAGLALVRERYSLAACFKALGAALREAAEVDKPS
ncbi:MAG TPA: glycosyltransferase family 4 protein [Kofleriaceae bacterium]|nr:glycosyltransferase family 4 protein [Kofleriaceae bacterium]